MAITREGPPSRRGLGNVGSVALVWASWDLGSATAGATLRTVWNISPSGCEELLGYPSEPGFQQDGVMDLGGREGAWRECPGPVESRGGRLLLDACSQGERKGEGC